MLVVVEVEVGDEWAWEWLTGGEWEVGGGRGESGFRCEGDHEGEVSDGFVEKMAGEDPAFFFKGRSCLPTSPFTFTAIAVLAEV